MTDDRLTTAIFDIGLVLIDWDPRHLYRTLFAGDEEGMERFLAEVTTPAWNHQIDAGRPWTEAVEELAALHPDQRPLIEAFHRRWPEMLGGANEATVEVLAELRAAGVRLLALSNWSAETFPIARARFGFLDWFEDIVVSGEVGIAKPDPGIFRILFERNAVDPREAVFIDDVEANVRAAEALGLTALRFETAARLRTDLVALGLLVPPEDPGRAASPRVAVGRPPDVRRPGSGPAGAYASASTSTSESVTATGAPAAIER